MLACILLQLVDQKDIVIRLVGVDQRYLCIVVFALENCMDELPDWRDSRSSSYKVELVEVIRFSFDLEVSFALVCNFTGRAVDIDRLAFLEGIKVVTYRSRVSKAR